MKIFIKIVLVIVISIIPILFIFYRAELPNRTDNGFTRRFVREPPHLLKEFNLGRDVRGIIGTRQGEILLSTDRADQLISISKATGAVRSIPTTASPITQHTLSTIHTFATRLEDDYLYLYDFSRTALYALDPINARLENTIHMGFFCSVIAAMRPDVAIVRGYDTARSSLLFGKISAAGNTLWEDNISLPSLDGGLSTDGQLIYDRPSGLLSYVHFYNNRVSVFDTLLQAKHTFTTLDTVAPKLRLDPTKPRLIINKTACIHEGILYVCSNLRADNETYQTYMKNIPVDRYDIGTGNYLGSFYLPVDDGKLIRDMRVINGRLYAFYFSGRLAVFSLPGTSS